LVGGEVVYEVVVVEVDCYEVGFVDGLVGV